MGHIGSHAWARHDHRDRADWARIRAQAVPDALVSIHNDSLAGDHREHVAFGAYAGTGSTADAIVRVDVRMLGLRSLGKEFAFFCGFARTGFCLLETIEIADQEEEADQTANAVSDDGIHGINQKYPRTNCNPICNSASTAKA